MKKTRKLGYDSYPDNKPHDLFPVLRIAGKYLRRFGFEIGQEVEFEISQGQITIKAKEQA